MSTKSRYLIKFKQGDLAYLRARILEDLASEHFAILLGKTQQIVDLEIQRRDLEDKLFTILQKRENLTPVVNITLNATSGPDGGPGPRQ